MTEGLIYDPLLEVERGLERDLATTKDECKRLRAKLEGRIKMAEGKEAASFEIKEAAERLCQALNDSLAFDTLRVQLQIKGGYGPPDPSKAEPYEVETKVLDIQEL